MTPFHRFLPARRDAGLSALDEAQEALSGWPLSPRTRHAVELALEELLSNAWKYAYPDGVPGTVEVTVDPRPGGIELTLVDDGRPFDPTSVPPAPSLALDEAVGGRGLHLVRSVSRSMRYRREDGRNVLVVELPFP